MVLAAAHILSSKLFEFQHFKLDKTRRKSASKNNQASKKGEPDKNDDRVLQRKERAIQFLQSCTQSFLSDFSFLQTSASWRVRTRSRSKSWKHSSTSDWESTGITCDRLRWKRYCPSWTKITVSGQQKAKRTRNKRFKTSLMRTTACRASRVNRSTHSIRKARKISILNRKF